MFGQKTPFGTTSTFGTTPAFGTTFGQTTQAAGTSTLFGAKPTVSFGNTTSNLSSGSLFGTPSSTFGATSATTGGGGLFGGTNTFSTPTAGTLFGGSSTQAKPLFGSTTTPFGTAATTQAATGFTFGGSTGGGLFGAQPQTSTTTSLFGSTAQPAAAGGGLFGASTVTVPTGTTVKFNPKIDTDTMLKNNISQNIQTKHQCITAMKEYESKSLEELRVEDYLANRKGPPAGTQPGFTFGSTLGQPQQQPQQTGGLFGATTTSAPSIFGQQNKPLFGGGTFGTATSTAPGTSLFGQPLQQQQQQQQQSTGLFGASANKPLFGATTTTAASTFTFNAPTATGGLFGQQQTQPSLFGTTAAAQPSLFGATAQQPAGSIFGTQNTGLAFGQQQPQQGQSLFGTTNAFAPSSTAFTGFGQPAASSAFGGTTNLFGAKTTTTAAPAFGGFGTNTFGTANTSFGGFGQPASQPSLFGAAQPQQQKSLFTGFGQPQPSFGAGTTGTTGAGLFGTSTFGTTGGQNLFGGTQQAKPTLNFGTTGFGGTNLGFGATGIPGMADPSQSISLGTTDAAAYIQQEILKSQLVGLSTSPYGDRKLILGNRMGDSTTLPAPTDPIAQKRIMESTKATTFGSGAPPAKPLPPFKPVSRLIVGSPKFGVQPDIPPPLQGIDSDTISFTEGFIPKKNIKKLIIKPKTADGLNASINSSLASATGHRDVSFPENRALTTAIRSNEGRPSEHSAVQALNFDNVTYAVESEGRSGHAPSSISTLPGVSLVSEDLGRSSMEHPARAARSIIIGGDTPPPAPASATSSASTKSPAVQASPSTISSASQTPASPDENSPQSDHPAGIILTRPEYYTIPSLKELEKMMDRATGDCIVNGFTVGRAGYGSVFWPGETNVAGLNLDDLVHFRHKEVTVYPDDEKRPPLGEELNKKAEITLERVWPVDKTTRLPIKDPKRLELMKYREKLEKATSQMEADFIDYRPETGSWVFQVPHFSKYGLTDEADEDQPSMMELETAQQQQPVQDKVQRLKTKKVAQKDAIPAQRAVVDVGFSLDTAVKGLGGIDDRRHLVDEDEMLTDVEFDGEPGRTDLSMSQTFSETTLYKTAPLATGLFSEFFRELRHQGKPMSSERDLAGILDELNDSAIEKGRRVKRRTIFSDLQEKSLLLLRKGDEDSAIVELSQQQQPEVVPSPAASFIGHRSDAVFLTRPKNELRLVPYAKSVTVNRSRFWHDAGLFNGRRFRVGWAPMGVLTMKGQVDQREEADQAASIFGAGRVLVGPKEFSIALSNAVHDIRAPLLADLDTLLKCQSDLSEFDFSNQTDRCYQLVPIEDTTKVLDMYEATASELHEPEIATSVFKLCRGLWGPLRPDETREELVSEWLIEQSRSIVDAAVEEIKRKGKDAYIDAVFALLTSRRIQEAAQIAQEAGDWRLSLIIGQMVASDDETKALWLQQLTQWAEVQADRFIDKTRLKIFILAAGILHWKTSDGRSISAYEGLDWKRTFGLHLWYACTPASSIRRALDQYDGAWRISKPKDGHEPATQPLTTYAESDPKSSRFWNPESMVKLDVCYHLLHLYIDRSYPICTVLEPSTWTPDPFDFHLSWHLWCVLRSIGLVIVERGRLDTLHAQYAFQLERKALWQRGVFVGLHVDDGRRREALIRQLLAQHSRECKEEEAAVLTNEFNIPDEWIQSDFC